MARLTGGVRLYFADVSCLEEDEMYEKAYSLLDSSRREKADRYKFNKDKRLCAGAGLLLQAAADDALGIPFGSLRMQADSNGKPRACGREGICLNISHSGTMVVCAAGPAECGCDIEKISDIKADIAGRFFTEEENAFVLANGDDGFFRIWTLKESFIKAVGLGLSLDLREFSILMPEERGTAEKGAIGVRQSVNPLEYSFREFDVAQGYKCSVCATGSIEPETVRVSLADLIRDRFCRQD